MHKLLLALAEPNFCIKFVANVTAMKKIFLLFLCSMVALATEAQVKWTEGSTDAIHEQAVKSGKLVFIDLYADWCGPCQMMNNRVFMDREVGEFFAQHFVAAKYNIERPTGRKLMQLYGKGSIPLYLVFNTEGELLGSILGASPKKEFLHHLEQIIAQKKEAR